MSRIIFVWIMTFSLNISSAQTYANVTRAEPAAGWKAGVAKVIITPDAPMWMAGYAARDHAAEGKLHELWAKALALEDADGHQAVLVTADLLGLPKGLSDRIRDRLEEKFGLSRAQLLFNSSHTHSAPVLKDALSDIYPLDADQRDKIGKYTDHLEELMVDLVADALAALEPAKLYAQNGVTRFQVNRRNNDAATLEQQTELKGPNDYAVPVIKVEDEAGDLMAVAFGYACHNTVLDGYQWSGDYAGFAQLALEKMYPGVAALFFQGAGADQNPLPRRTLALAQQYGRTLAASVDRVLQEDMQELAPQLATAYKEIDIALAEPPTREALEKMIATYTSYQKRWAERMLGRLENGETFETAYPYPIQVWKLGDQTIFSLGGELVVEYAIRLKQIFGQDIFVLGYTNDVMAYIPSAKILEEGGYEGASSQMVYGLPALWTSDIETHILDEMQKLAAEIKLTLTQENK